MWTQLPGKFVVDMAYVGDHGGSPASPSYTTQPGLPGHQVRGALFERRYHPQAGNAACNPVQTPVTAPYAGFAGTVSHASEAVPHRVNADVGYCHMAIRRRLHLITPCS